MIYEPPSHAFAELYHAGSERLARLRQVLDASSGHVVLPGNPMDRHFVAEIAELQREVETVVPTRRFDLLWRNLFKHRTLGPSRS